MSNSRHMEWLDALKTMRHRGYWNKANTVEFAAFVIKAAIIIPGLLFNLEFWWLYMFALISSFGLIWSSTIKTIPTLIWFNILWIILSLFAILNLVLV